MGSILGKGGAGATTGFRYYFAVLAGICRGPVDEIMLIKSADHILFDGQPQGFYPLSYYDPDPPEGTITEGDDPGNSDPTQQSGTIHGNRTTLLTQDQLFGGDESEGGINGLLWTYFGAKTQVIPADDWIRTAMAGVRLSALRGVVTTFFDGLVSSNTPYPKAWTYRVRRALAGWDGDVWYPEKAKIMLTDSAIPQFTRGTNDTGITMTTSTFAPGSSDDTTGASTGSSTQITVTSNYSGETINTYSSDGGDVSSVAVPREYNEIAAMNPAHIVFECVTNRDWGRGMNRALIDHVSFAAAADTLYAENFGLCLKWSRTEDVDVFIQVVIDHIGGVVYTDRLTGLLCLRLMRDDYDAASLSVFDYDHGLMEVTSVNTAANDTNPNEIIVTYVSPVLDAQKEARQQNIASITQLGCVFSTTKDYSGLPTSDLAIRVAARDLRVASVAWTNVQFKVDRRGYLITPGDCLILNAPERGLNNIVIRVATVEDTVMTDGSISVVGSRDVYGLPAAGYSQAQPSDFLVADNSPKPTTDYRTFEASYYDAYRLLNGTPEFTDATAAPGTYLGFQIILATKPTTSALNYKIKARKFVHFTSTYTDWYDGGVGQYSSRAATLAAIGASDVRFAISNGLQSPQVTLPQLMILVGPGPNDVQEFVYVTSFDRDTTTGIRYANVKRGCIDTVSVPHAIGASLYNYQQTGAIDTTEYTFNDIAEDVLITHTTRGDITTPYAQLPSAFQGFAGRIGRAYPPANFVVQGYGRGDEPAFDTSKTIVLTFKYRNAQLQQDQVLGDLDDSVTPPVGLTYQVYFYADGVDKNTSYLQNTDNNGASNILTLDLSKLPAGMVGHRIEADLQCQFGTDYPIFTRVGGSSQLHFNLTAPPRPTTGFDNNFDQHFDGA